MISILGFCVSTWKLRISPDLVRSISPVLVLVVNYLLSKSVWAKVSAPARAHTHTHAHTAPRSTPILSFGGRTSTPSTPHFARMSFGNRRVQKVGTDGKGVVCKRRLRPRGIRLGVHVPVHILDGLGIKRRQGCACVQVVRDHTKCKQVLIIYCNNKISW